MAVAPAFVDDVVGIDNHALAGLVAGSIFVASAVAQIGARGISPQRAKTRRCWRASVGMPRTLV